MSTTPNPLNGNGGVTEDEFYTYLREQAAKALAEEARVKAAADAARTGAPPIIDEPAEPLKLKIFGQEREFKDANEISSAVERLVNEYQTNLAAAQQALAAKQGTEKTVVEEPKVDLDEFVNRIQKDPTDAIDYAFKQKYGVGMDYLLNQARRTEEIEGALVAIQFKEMNEDFVPNQNNTNMLNGIRANLGLPFNVQGLNAAYAVGKQYGVFANTAAAQPQQQSVDNRVTPPPSINMRNASIPSQSEDLIEMVERMSPDKAAEFVQRMSGR